MGIPQVWHIHTYVPLGIVIGNAKLFLPTRWQEFLLYFGHRTNTGAQSIVGIAVSKEKPAYS